MKWSDFIGPLHWFPSSNWSDRMTESESESEPLESSRYPEIEGCLKVMVVRGGLQYDLAVDCSSRRSYVGRLRIWGSLRQGSKKNGLLLGFFVVHLVIRGSVWSMFAEMRLWCPSHLHSVEPLCACVRVCVCVTMCVFHSRVHPLALISSLVVDWLTHLSWFIWWGGGGGSTSVSSATFIAKV